MKQRPSRDLRAVGISREIAHDLVEIRNLIDAGLEAALKELQGAADHAALLTQRNDDAELEALDRLDKQTVDQIERLEGKIEYFVADGASISAADFEQLAKPLIAALQLGRLDLAGANPKVLAKLGDLPGELECAWRDLQRCLEVIRIAIRIRDQGSQLKSQRLVSQISGLLADAAKRAELITCCDDLLELIDSIEPPLEGLLESVAGGFCDFLNLYIEHAGLSKR